MLYRVFVTRHYIAVDWFDLQAESPAKARRIAERQARRQKPDVRAEATDNGWHADEPVTVRHAGQFGSSGKGRHKMKEIAPGVFSPVE